jgi:hypothetical protein
MKQSVLYFLIILSLACSAEKKAKRLLLTKSPIVKKINTRQNKEIVFIGMQHFASKDYYAKTKSIIEDLVNKGYFFYLENIYANNYTFGTSYTNQDYELVQKKFRRMVGFDVDNLYKTLESIEFAKLNELMAQPSDYKELGVTKRFSYVDYSVFQLVYKYETLYGKITLDSCDNKTDLEEVYSCKGLTKIEKDNFYQKILLEYRNKQIAELLHKTLFKKIAVIYGADHYVGIQKIFKELDK